MLRKTLLALSISALLSACSTTSETAINQSKVAKSAISSKIHSVNVTQAKSASDNHLICNQPQSNKPACNLRMYQVMVESFIDADSNADFGTAYGTSHHKGDIAGITASLDYIKSLGMNTVWLTPIFESVAIEGQSDWIDRLDATGYFASNYFKIDPHFGTLAQAKELVKQAHAKGMYVIFDGVFGHHKGNVVPSPEGRLPTSGAPVGNVGFEAKYPDDLAFYKEVATYWVNELQIDGWRLDQAYQVPVKDWAEIRKAVEKASAAQTYKLAGQKVNPLGYMVAEIWRTGANDIALQGYGSDKAQALPSAFDFPVRYSVVQTFAVDENSGGNRPATHLDDGLFSHMAYPEHAMPNLMLGNHDLVRFGDLLQRGYIADPKDPEYWDRHKAAFSFMAAYSGPITIYYGEEIGDQVDDFEAKYQNCDGASGLCDDHVARTSAKIEGIATTVGGKVTVLNKQEADLKNYVSSLMAMRAANPALYNGSRTHIYSDENVYIDRKDAADDHVLYLVNTKGKEAKIKLKSSAIGSEGELTNLLAKQNVSLINGQYEITLPGFTAAFYKITSPTKAGPSINTKVASLTGTGILAKCDAPTVKGKGPLEKTMWIRGTYKGGDGFNATPTSRKFKYKGNGVYQVVVKEAKPGAFAFKFAAADWSSEFAVVKSKSVIIGQEQPIQTASGYGTESPITIPEAGTYVYSFKVDKSLHSGTMMVSKCK
ncbi:alpha-amylase family protein [Psychromonas antarctica]|uniref:alpha-amylase family protein n=1 Tax=Psychromonas antarctica TaxID=67573 RepID=UPI001EE92B76|nr:alpha-amylase family protein [Psychromonas antarctica]MCG6200050.1 glycosidase [Psychromonas antarctica]